jgi:hypothetical protein
VKLIRRFLVAVAALIAVVGLAPQARADDAMWRNFRGRVVFSDVALAPAANFGSSATMTAALKRLERSTVDQNAGFWRLHLLAFLDRPAATGTLVLRALDVSDPRAPHQVRSFEVPVERGNRELRLDDFVVTKEMGFVPGATYEITLEAPHDEGSGTAPAVGAPETAKAGKADVYAKGVITLR